MSEYKNDYIKYRVNKCEEAMSDALLFAHSRNVTACDQRKPAGRYG